MYVTCVRGHKKRIWKIDKGFLLAISCITASLCKLLFRPSLKIIDFLPNFLVIINYFHDLQVTQPIVIQMMQ